MVNDVSSAAADVAATDRWTRRYREAVDMAAKAFAEGGYRSVSTTDIASRLGIRQGSLYYYFASKEAALSAVCELGAKSFIDRLREILASQIPAPAKLKAALASHLLPLRSRPEADYVRVFVRHRHELPDGPRQKVAALARSYQGLIEQLFADGVNKNEFRPSLEPRLATLALLGLCNSVIAARTLPRGLTIDEVVEDYTRIFIEGVEARP